MSKELELWQFVSDRLQQRQPVMLLVVADSSGSSPGRQGYKMAVGVDGGLAGSIGAADFIYREKLGPKNELYIVGGGHCALALSELMSRMDFHIRIFDDRPELNTLEKNRFADEITIIESYDRIGEMIADGGPNIYVVVMTLGYASDAVVIRKLIGKDFKYFGVLGSRAKMKTLLKDFRKGGFREEMIARVHTPIGLPINSQTPEEIAISIAAQIIAVKNGALF